MSTPKVWEKNMSTTPKLINFPHFLDSQEFEKNMSTPKLIIFPFFGFQEFEKKHVITKTSQFSHLLDSRSLRKNMSKWGNFPIFWIPGVEKYIYIYVCVYACLFKPFWKKTLFLGATLHFHILPSILVYADGSKFQSVNTKTVCSNPFERRHCF